jgi:hypothetical protein
LPRVELRIALGQRSAESDAMPQYGFVTAALSDPSMRFRE